MQIPGAIVSNLALNGYSTLSELANFGHKDFEYFCSSKIRHALSHGGASYNDKVIKRLHGMVWRASKMKRLNQLLLINNNLTRYEANKWDFEALVEVEKLYKEFEIESPWIFLTLSA